MKKIELLLLAALLVVGFAGCGGGGDDGAPSSPSQTLNVAGTWSRQPLTNNTAPIAGLDNAPRDFSFTQLGTSLTLTATDLWGNTASWTGTLAGDTATGAFTYAGSTSTITIVFSGENVGDTCTGTFNPPMPDGNGATIKSITLTKTSD